MRSTVRVASVAALLLSVLVMTGTPAGAQPAPEGFSPISIYSLDDGKVDDSIPDPALKTPDGEVVGSPETTADRFGNANGALLLDGKDDYVLTKENSNINPLTFSAWFRADDVTGERSIVDSDVNSKYGHSLIIGYKDPKETGTAATKSGDLAVQYHDGDWDTGVAIQPGVWTLAFVTYSRNEIRLYVGTQTEPVKLVGRKPYNTKVTFDGDPFRFGRHNSDDPQWFKGAIDDVRFYDKELTQKDIDKIITSSYGDVHVRTPDGLAYNYHSPGDFVLTRSTAGGVEVQARQEALPRTPQFSVNTAAALSVAGDKVEFYLRPEPRFVVNNVPMQLVPGELGLPKGGSIFVEQNRSLTDVTITWPDRQTGARVIRVGDSHFDIGIKRLSGSLTYEGFLGNLDKDPRNDLRPRGGEQIATPADATKLKTFGDSWRVPAGETLFRDAAPTGAAGTTGALILRDQVPDSDAQDEAAQTCQDAGVSDPLAVENCAFDVAATGDTAFVESAMTYQAAVETSSSPATAIVPAVEPTTDRTSSGGLLTNPLLLAGVGALVVVVIVVVVLMRRRRS